MFTFAAVLALAASSASACTPLAFDSASADARAMLEGGWYTGVVERGRRLTLVAPSAGEVRRAPVRAGSRVKAGELLVVLRSRATDAEFDAARSDEVQARAALDAARAERERSAQQLARREARPELFAAEDREAARQALAVATAAVTQAWARLELAQERMRRARELREGLALRAAAAGLVVRADLLEGASVEAGDVIAVIEHGDALSVRFLVPDAAPMISVGEPVCVESGPGGARPGVVREVAMDADPRLGGRVAVAEITSRFPASTGTLARVAASRRLAP